jgi:hypothetical protein
LNPHSIELIWSILKLYFMIARLEGDKKENAQLRVEAPGKFSKS